MQFPPPCTQQKVTGDLATCFRGASSSLIGTEFGHLRHGGHVDQSSAHIVCSDVKLFSSWKWEIFVLLVKHSLAAVPLTGTMQILQKGVHFRHCCYFTQFIALGSFWGGVRAAAWRPVFWWRKYWQVPGETNLCWEGEEGSAGSQVWV